MGLFGLSLVKTEKYQRYSYTYHGVKVLYRWLSGFTDLDILWDYVLDTPENAFTSVEDVRRSYAKFRETDVYGLPLVLKQVETLEKQVKESAESVRYALATFRSLDLYTFADSDHGLLIAEAVKKLEAVEPLVIKHL